MTLGKIIDKLLKYHAEALVNPNIHKPYAFAVYQTWKWVDEHEKARQLIVQKGGDTDECNNNRNEDAE